MDWWIDETPPRPGDSEKDVSSILEVGSAVAIDPASGQVRPTDDPNEIYGYVYLVPDEDGRVVITRDKAFSLSRGGTIQTFESGI